jgi:hypothetical protein
VGRCWKPWVSREQIQLGENFEEAGFATFESFLVASRNLLEATRLSISSARPLGQRFEKPSGLGLCHLKMQLGQQNPRQRGTKFE